VDTKLLLHVRMLLLVRLTQEEAVVVETTAGAMIAMPAGKS